MTSSKKRGPGRGLVLEVVRVSVSYGAVQALDEVSLAVKEGQFVGLIGPNGAGKTTCFNAISGYATPAHGWIRLDGRRITQLSPAQRARAGIARTFQNIGLDKKASVADNLLVARECTPLSATRRGCGPAAGVLSAAALTERLGLAGVLQTRVDELPIGTSKLVELACALVRRPRLLLLDEPSSGLGAPERAELRDLLRDLHRETNLSMLMIEHDMDLAMSTVDHVYVLNFGTPLAAGSPNQIREDPAVIDAYLGTAA